MSGPLPSSTTSGGATTASRRLVPPPRAQRRSAWPTSCAWRVSKDCLPEGPDALLSPAVAALPGVVPPRVRRGHDRRFRTAPPRIVVGAARLGLRRAQERRSRALGCAAPGPALHRAIPQAVAWLCLRRRCSYRDRRWCQHRCLLGRGLRVVSTAPVPRPERSGAAVLGPADRRGVGLPSTAPAPQIPRPPGQEPRVPSPW